jgi:sulfate transport system ATP-binding protein
VIEQIGTPEQVYMEPATPFVSDFVGEINKLPGGVHVRPHDLKIVETGGDQVIVDNVFRKGGVWRVEGLIGGDRVVELDVDASLDPPAPGETIRIRPRRAQTFTPTGAFSHEQA